MKLHNAMWPGLVGKEPNTDHPPIALEQMLDMTVAANVDGHKFDGVDLFLFHPHTDPDISEDNLKKMADLIASKGLKVGSLVAPVWGGTVGDSAMGTDEQQQKFLLAIEKACRVAKLLNKHGVRQYGVIRVDSAEFGVQKWRENPKANTARIVDTFKKAAKIAEGHGERIAAEGEICWAGMHSWRQNVKLLEMVGRPDTLGFQADMAHTMLFTMGYNAPEDALLPENFDWNDTVALGEAYKTMARALRPWMIDFHVAQNDGTVKGSGSHDKTGRHCQPFDPNGRLDIVRDSGAWLRDDGGNLTRAVQHICWDGCMFSNDVMLNQQTWNEVLQAMISVRDAHGWS